MLSDARFAHERRHDDDHGPAVRDLRRRHVGGLIVTTSRRKRHSGGGSPRGQELLPRRFRSSALARLRCGSACHWITGPVGTAEAASIVALSSHMADHGDRSYPQFVFTASDEACAQGVSLNNQVRITEGVGQGGAQGSKGVLPAASLPPLSSA